MKKKIAFTLSEVLITLGIIGVIAAITIPSLITKNKAKRLKSQYLKAYSTIAQAIKMMKYDEVSLDNSTYGNGVSFKKAYAAYFKTLDLCLNANSNPLCDVASKTTFKTLDGKRYIPSNLIDDGQFVLLDGTLLMFENPYFSSNPVIWIHADINGIANKPNKLGYDVFTFCVLNEELVPMGAAGTRYSDMDKYCNPNVSNQYNGFACAQKAMSDDTYFDKIVQKVK